MVREYCGHGIGKGFHEDPQVLHYGKTGTGMALEAGMTFTIEPGIYIPGKGGVRVEDDVLVTEDGLESFSVLPRGLTTIG